MTRKWWVAVHRYAGLTMTIFLIIVGLTGSLLAFLPELDRVLTPHLFPPPRQEVPLPAFVLIERAEALVADTANIGGVEVSTPGSARVLVTPKIDDSTGKAFPLAFNQLFFDPYTGEELGRRRVGGLPNSLDNLMPFIYELHMNLALGETGAWLLGIIAVIWTVDCFIAFYLTFPMRRPRCEATSYGPGSGRKNWGRRWLPAWKVRWKSSGYKLNFDLHRAGGLWLWPALLVFAWSSVNFNMKSVYVPVTRLLFDYPGPEATLWGLPNLEKPLQHPRIGWRQAQLIAERLMAEQAQRHGFSVERPVAMYLNRAKGFYTLWVHSSLDIPYEAKGGATVIAIDANTGAFKGLHLPTGQHSGDTVSHWLVKLHMARVFGMPYKIFVCTLGMIIILLSVTGLVIWSKKRNAKRVMHVRKSYN